MQLSRLFCAALTSALLVSPCLASGQNAPLTLAVDLTDAPRKILHSQETMPAQPGPMTLVYPEWIPGEHGPTGPVVDQAGFIITTQSGERVKWERDPVNMYAYNITVPQGATELNIKMDFLATASAEGFSAGASTSANLALLSWNELVVYPEGPKASDVMVTPSLKVPEGWKFGTALEPTSAPAQSTSFKTVSLEQLVDSPVLAGRWFKEIPLATDVTPKHYLAIAGDGPEDLHISKEH